MIDDDKLHRLRPTDSAQTTDRHVPGDPPVHPPSPEELERLVISHLSRGRRRRPWPLWLLRLVSVAIAVLVLLLLFALLPDRGTATSLF